LSEIALGWEKTGVPLVGFDGQNVVPAACGDDVGIYFVIPMLAKLARTNIGDAIELFFVGIVLCSGLLGAAGLILVCRTFLGRLVAIVAVILISLLALKTQDVYAVQSSAVVAFVPWILFFGTRAPLLWSTLPFTFLVSALLAGANLMRSNAGTPVLIFMTWILIFLLQSRRSFKLFLSIALLLGSLLPICYSHLLLRARDTCLQKHGYDAVGILSRHVFWHVIYVGFGFIRNDVVPGYLDGIAAAKVREIAPQTIYPSPEYEEYLKREVIHIVTRHPLLVMETVAAKVGVVAGWLLLSANLGLIAAYNFPKHWSVELAFWSAITLQALPGIVAIPLWTYLLGFIAFAMLYAVISIDVALQCDGMQKVLGLIWPRREGAGYDRRHGKPQMRTANTAAVMTNICIDAGQVEGPAISRLLHEREKAKIS